MGHAVYHCPLNPNIMIMNNRPQKRCCPPYLAKGENLMKCGKLYLVLLMLLTITPLAFANPMQILGAAERVLAILESLQSQKNLDEIKERQLIDLMGDIRGVITTLSEVSGFTETSRQERVYENSLIPLGQSLDKSYSLAEMLLRDGKITVATHLISSFEQLSTLKKQVLVELGQTSVANSFQQNADQKRNNLEAAKKVACDKKILTVTDNNTTKLKLVLQIWYLTAFDREDLEECKKK